MTQKPSKPIKPGSRPGGRWCDWLQAILTWTPEERAVARQKADKAWLTRSTRAQYAGLGEMRALDDAEAGTLKHTHRCADRNCPIRPAFMPYGMGCEACAGMICYQCGMGVWWFRLKGERACQHELLERHGNLVCFDYRFAGLTEYRRRQEAAAGVGA